MIDVSLGTSRSRRLCERNRRRFAHIARGEGSWTCRLARGTSSSMSDRPPKFFRRFVQEHPEVAKAYEALGEAVRQGPLTEREVALVKLAFSLGARLEGGAHAHARKALAAGVEPEALEQVALLAIPTLGFPAAMAGRAWIRETIARDDD